MNLGILGFGLAKVLFGILIAVAGLFLASRALSRSLKTGDTDAQLKEGNVAVAVLHGAAMLAVGILGMNTVRSTFSAMDLLASTHGYNPEMLLKAGAYALVHVVVSLVVGTLSLTIAARAFGMLTRGVDEIASIKQGNVAPALLLGVVLVVMALLVSPGLQTALDGILPLPILGRDEVSTPS